MHIAGLCGGTKFCCFFAFSFTAFASPRAFWFSVKCLEVPGSAVSQDGKVHSRRVVQDDRSHILEVLPELNLELPWLGGKHIGVGPEVELTATILFSIDS